jgi:hypothetical protein
MSNASHERTSRLWARASLFETAAGISSQLQLRASLERPFRANCGSGPRSSGHFARQLQPFRANCGSWPGSSDHFEPTAAPGHPRADHLSGCARVRSNTHEISFTDHLSKLVQITQIQLEQIAPPTHGVYTSKPKM